MALHPGEVTRFKTALRRSVLAASTAETVEFTDRLKKLSVDRIGQLLANHKIGRAWKRDLAEAELERRRSANSEPQAHDDGLETTTPESASIRWPWWMAAALIVASMAIMIYAAFVVWNA